jgi:hypothetical protein
VVAAPRTTTATAPTGSCGFHWLGGTSTDAATGRTVETGTRAHHALQRPADNGALFVALQGLNNGWADTDGQAAHTGNTAPPGSRTLNGAACG